jgi:hypothetical protein
VDAARNDYCVIGVEKASFPSAASGKDKKDEKERKEWLCLLT